MSKVRVNTPLLLVFLILLCQAQASAQACGYIYAKFDVRNSQGRPLADAKFEFLRRESSDSILYVEKELSYSADTGTFKLRHGLCGSHGGTRLVIRHPSHEDLEAVVDLPLNTPRTEHFFAITLKRKGSDEKASIEQWAALQGSVEDAAGRHLGNIRVSLTGEGGSRLEATSDEFGSVSFSVRKGRYLLEAPTQGGVTLVDLDLAPGPRWETIRITNP